MGDRGVMTKETVFERVIIEQAEGLKENLPFIKEEAFKEGFEKCLEDMLSIKDYTFKPLNLRSRVACYRDESICGLVVAVKCEGFEGAALKVTISDQELLYKNLSEIMDEIFAKKFLTLILRGCDISDVSKEICKSWEKNNG